MSIFMPLPYRDLVEYLERGDVIRVPLIPDVMVQRPPSEPTAPPLEAPFIGDDVRFEWVQPSNNFSDSALLIMAATGVELYLTLFAPDRGSEPAWRMVQGILFDPSDPDVRTTEREKNAILDGYQAAPDPWRGNPHIREALESLYEGIRNLNLQKISNNPYNPWYRHQIVNSLYESIRALALMSGVQLPINYLMAVAEAEYFQRPDGSMTNTYVETSNYAEEMFEYWIRRWWNLVERRLPFQEPFYSEIS